MVGACESYKEGLCLVGVGPRHLWWHLEHKAGRRPYLVSKARAVICSQCK